MSLGSGLMTTQLARRPHLAKVTGEVGDLRRDVNEELSPMAAIAIEEYTNPAAAAPAGLEVLTATTVAPRTVTSFLGPGVAALLAYGRNVTISTAGVTASDAPATALVTGTYKGSVQTETLTVPQTATIVTGTKPFDTIVDVAYAAADGTGATNSIGFGSGLGMTKLPVSRAGLVTAVKEIEAGVVVTTGVFTVDRLYTPGTVPDATNDYAFYYEYDPTVA